MFTLSVPYHQKILMLIRSWIVTWVVVAMPYQIHAQLSGWVKEQGTMMPLAGARVTVQATTIRTVTDANGYFSLPGATGNDLVVVGAKESFYNQALLLNAPADSIVLTLTGVPQDTNSTYVFMEPSTCGACHPDQWNQWTTSAMAHAGLNQWVYDIYNGTGTSGGMGGFVYTRDSHHAGVNPNSECASCHQPQVWIKNPFSPLEDNTNPSADALAGVSCDVCHKMAHIDETKTNFPGIYPGVVTFTRPALGSSQVEYGVLGDASYVLNPLMRPSYQPQLTAAVCAACHQDKNDPDDDGDFEEPDGVVSEPTYQEWLNSPYADTASASYATCVTCHMPSYGATQVCAVDPVTRDSSTIRSHWFEGSTAAYLERAVTLDLNCDKTDSTVSVEVVLTNTGTGHHVPTGVTFRNMILLVEAWRESDSLSLPHTGTQTIHDLGGIGNPGQGYYAGLPGKFYSKINHDSAGNGPVFYTDATGLISDNRLAALASDTTHYVFSIPNPDGQFHVRARLIYRRAYRYVVDAKGWTLDGYGAPLEDIQPPHFGHLMAQAEWTSDPLALHPGATAPDHFVLLQNYPNPFNPATKISYELSAPGRVRLAVYNVLGQEVIRIVDGPQTAGRHSAMWDGMDRAGKPVASGIYFYRLDAGGRTRTMKMALVR